MTYSNRSEGTSICVPKDSTVSEGGPKKYPCYAANFMMVVMGGKAEIGVWKKFTLKQSHKLIVLGSF